MQLVGAAEALMTLAASSQREDERARFLAGRACEVLLKLPLDLETRTQANAICKVPLQDVAQYRLGTERERGLQRPRRIEWLLLTGLMVLGIAALIFAAMALGRS